MDATLGFLSEGAMPVTGNPQARQVGVGTHPTGNWAGDELLRAGSQTVHLH